MSERYDFVFCLTSFCATFLIGTACLYASQSTLTESEGYACMGDDKSIKQTESAAVADAKRKAVEQAVTYVRSETQVKNYELEKDVINAYSRASVKMIEKKYGTWYKDSQSGNCYKVLIKAEVILDAEAMEKVLKNPRERTTKSIGDNSAKDELLAEVLTKYKYEYGWSGGLANLLLKYNTSYYPLTKVVRNGRYLRASYSWKNGILEGEVVGKKYFGTWSHSKGHGEFELIFNDSLTQATGWWNNGANKKRHAAYMRRVE